MKHMNVLFIYVYSWGKPLKISSGDNIRKYEWKYVSN